MSMKNFDLNARLLMFATCTSIEYDLRKLLSESSEKLVITKSFQEKAIYRNNKIKNVEDDLDLILLELDLGDLIAIIKTNSELLDIDDENNKSIQSILSENVVQIRNRIMHTRPLEFSDKAFMQEILETLDKNITCIKWNKLIQTREELINNPQKLLSSIRFIPEQESSKIIHNSLPEPEFDDTGYVGRKLEVKELKNLIESDNNQIITVVGNGGIGKTALVVKCLYDLLDSQKANQKFDAIIWTTLKTKSLSNAGFKKIGDAITSVSGFLENVQSKIISENSNPRDSIISFMKELPTLLVIDNLETIASSDIIEFLKSIPSNSKVLITSRVGLGELENRYELRQMNLQDAKKYFISLSKSYQLEVHKTPSQDIELLIKNLYSTPLMIKWYLTSLKFGTDSNSIIGNKKEAIEFSMSNIIEKLDDNEIKILWLLVNEGRSLTYGELSYFLNSDNNDSFNSSINRLRATSMLILDSSGYRYAINDMAKDYLVQFRPSSREFMKEIQEQRNELNKLLETINIKNKLDPFDLFSIRNNLDNENNKIASVYLSKALDFCNKKKYEEANCFLKKASSVAPDYFEVYKIDAFISAEAVNYPRAQEYYRIALENTDDPVSIATIHYNLSVFYSIKLQDYPNAKQNIKEANKLVPNNDRITLEMVRAFTNMGEFHEAEEKLKSINLSEDTTVSFLNQYITKALDLYFKWIQNIDPREYNKRYFLITDSLNYVDNLNRLERKTSIRLIRMLNELLKHKNYLPAKEQFNKYYLKYQSDISKIKEMFSKLNESTLSSFGSLPNENIFNKGKITFIDYHRHFGFINNGRIKYYFNLRDVSYPEPEKGDAVSFDTKESQRGPIAYNINIT